MRFSRRPLAGNPAQCLRYRIGDIDVSLKSELPDVLADFETLYRGSRTSAADATGTIRMEVRREGRTKLGRPRYRVYGDGEGIGPLRRPAETLPFLEWGINWRVIATRSEFLQVHAASLVHRGRGFVFAGTSGSGKSTLGAGLLARGWQYLGDEFALIHPETCCLHAFPKALCIKSGSFPVVKKLGLPFCGGRHYIKGLKGTVGYINPHDVGNDLGDEPVPVRYVIFPRHVDGATPRMAPISRARAAFSLAHSMLNRTAFGDRAVDSLSRVVAGADCFALESGDIEPTCDLIESLVGSDQTPAN